MDKYILQLLEEALQRCKNTVAEVAAESDDKGFVAGMEVGSQMVLYEVEKIINAYLK
ncbi:hypothetical protein [Geosporobacter ferrireducens]|uniref:hypothetical protein n=1 Tax=Geosporobacter ferrireducens TaxID=1424294 RepID=UPI0023576470|nr:hypothetical protein [Geosporobacter ferrireducens]